jgi:hypothetical protein
MNAHTGYGSLSALDALAQRLLPGQARRVGHGSGDLTVIAGRVWLTGQGDCEDRVLAAGERIHLDAADAVVVESFDRTQHASVAWKPRSSLITQLSTQLRLRELLAATFAALARKAASKANRAQGCMS